MFAFAPLLALTSVVSAQTPVVSAPTPATAHVSQLKAASGANLGKVTVTGTSRGVLLHIEATGLPPGWHGMHFHDKADCSDPAFKTAGAHVHGAAPVVHGLLNADANDPADLPNLYVAPDGSATVELFTPLVTLQATDNRPALFDADGSALIIHANPDDYLTQPIGGSGARIACATLR